MTPKQSFFFGRQDEILRRIDNIERSTYLLIQQSRRIMADLKDVDVALAGVDTDVATLITDNQAILAQLQAGPQTADTAAQVAHIQAIDVALKALVANDAAALNPPAPTT